MGMECIALQSVTIVRTSSILSRIINILPFIEGKMTNHEDGMVNKLP